LSAYYNEHDEYCAQWLRNLIAAGHIAPGVVDTRSIEDVRPVELRGFTQCHFFAGIGVWSAALRQAGWRDDRPVWTGSCPCQPFSAAGKGDGFSDERHLWPAWFHLIEQCRPDVVFGEQVASGDGLSWLDLVHSDLEAADYACGAVDLCAAGVGAPHIRQRLWFVADAIERTHQRSIAQPSQRTVARGNGALPAGIVGDTSGKGLSPRECALLFGQGRWEEGRAVGESGRSFWADAECFARPPSMAYGVADDDDGRQRLAGLRVQGPEFHDPDGRGPLGGFWAGADWIACRDDKWRPVEPGTFPLAHGAATRVGRLRAYGNAIVKEAGAAVVAAYMECCP
jgi:DNA (cytosine-5)-methyltransferase 1